MVRVGRVRRLVVGGLLAAAVATGLIAAASSGSSSDEGRTVFRVRLTGFQEDPAALSTSGSGRVRVELDDAAQQITYRLNFMGLEAPATQAHIHFGGRAQSGGIAVFLCSNLGNGPMGTPACPAD